MTTCGPRLVLELRQQRLDPHICASDAARVGRATVRGDVSLMDGVFATSERFWLLDEF